MHKTKATTRPCISGLLDKCGLSFLFSNKEKFNTFTEVFSEHVQFENAAL